MGNYGYKDNFPHNIEAPQRVNFQYSEDITFDYSNGKYPLGEAHEGFLWEDVYIPVEHVIGAKIVGKHVWMRMTVGLNSDWTLPMRLTDSFTNIDNTDIEYDTINGSATFRIKYTLADGTVIYSEPITIQNGIDGRGISSSVISNSNLILYYTDGTSDNVGRVVGYDGTGVPIGAPDGYHLVSILNVPSWQDFNVLLNSKLTANSPLDFTSSLLTHLDTDGNRHIPINGNDGDALTTDGNGNYTWVSLTNPINGFIPWTALDDSATSGSTTNLFSADKILSLLGGNSFGIKYSVNTIPERDALTGMVTGELCVVNNEPNRPVYNYDGTNWVWFFDLDAAHTHPEYALLTDLTSGAINVSWNTLIDLPTLYTQWTVLTDIGSLAITNNTTLEIVGANGLYASLAGNLLTIGSIIPPNLFGQGLDYAPPIVSHAIPIPVATNTSNLNGYVLQNMSFDIFGHVTSVSNLNMDTRYYTTNYVDSNYYTITDADNQFIATPGTGNPIKTEIIDIASWSMYSNYSTTVSFILPVNNILVSYSAIIYNDYSKTNANSKNYPLAYTDLTYPNPNGSIFYEEITNKFVLTRLNNGFFHNAGYLVNPDGVRGYIHITYREI